jgi:hypothetical protein
VHGDCADDFSEAMSALSGATLWVLRATHFVDLVEPLPIVEPDHWELGLSELGVTTVLH